MNDPNFPDLQAAPDLPPASQQEIAAASFYDSKLVPALFYERVAQTIEAARVEPGARALDVACGTGVLTRELAPAVGPGLRPVGLDISPGMLAVASSISPEIEWRHGDANQLPFADASFDRVLCQFGLMFFDDPVRALAEMLRVLKPGGRLAVAVWDSISANPGSAAVRDTLDRLAGPRAAQALELPYRYGDTDELRDFAAAAGIGEFELVTHPGRQNFPSLDVLIDAEIRGWLPIMGVELDEALIETIRDECEARLRKYVRDEDGSLIMPGSAHVFSGIR